MTERKRTRDIRERNFETVRKKIKSLSSRSMKVLDAAFCGDETLTTHQIIAAGEILKINAMIHCQEEGFDWV